MSFLSGFEAATRQKTLPTTQTALQTTWKTYFATFFVVLADAERNTDSLVT